MKNKQTILVDNNTKIIISKFLPKCHFWKINEFTYEFKCTLNEYDELYKTLKITYPNTNFIRNTIM